MPKHSTEIEGYEGQLERLCEDIHRMEYGRVAEFYEYSAADLLQQAAKDRVRGRTRLASLLEEAAATAEIQQKRFEHIWTLCKPHMENE